ncbi:putative transcription factor bHLH family [Rosa chinensis]|uniref:Putative transcription factor bHLH family n=1 Tax=Rosa chinensis TaxID=74649 RepID=A0A2P6SHC4_ROSCH|nr:transcription factor EGL1 [Rosa chinensis]PRQ58069.1 putative transcription factor bHLH family [Rosa chinensis]
MANGTQIHERVPENLRKQFAVAVRSIKWSYAIFWSLSTTQQGVLEWGEGYYNGDIKTRKTVEGIEPKADKIGLQRNEQLRELYKALLEGESTDQQAKVPSAALSPEDLTDAEWYYLLCMSFVFNIGEGLPGRALANGKSIWLCNAQYADSKVFSRSLLAKSASIQTVVCFPYLGGVVELGVTELVAEDPSLLQHIKASLLDFSKPDCSEKASSAPHKADEDSDQILANIVGHEIVDTLGLENLYSPSQELKFDQSGINGLHGHDEEFSMGSADECSRGCEHNHQTEDSFMLEAVNGGASQVQSWHFMDDDFSNGFQDSMNSSDCISEAFVNQGKAHSSTRPENKNHSHLKELQNFNDTKFSSLDLGPADDHLHYKRTLSAVLGNSMRIIENPYFCSGGGKSSFVQWKKGVVYKCSPKAQQKLLKKILFTVPLMMSGGSPSPQKEIATNSKSESDDMHEKMRENEKLLVLRSMVPSMTEIDRASILDDTIKYLKELEARAEEIESCMDTVEAIARRKFLERAEKASDNYDKTKTGNPKKPWINKRKACDIDESDPELNRLVSKESLPLDVKVSVKEQEVLIEMRCPYREYILLDIMDAVNSLYLDAHSVQSSTLNDVLTLSLKSKFRGSAIAPVGMIKQALWKIAGKC